MAGAAAPRGSAGAPRGPEGWKGEGRGTKGAGGGRKKGWKGRPPAVPARLRALPARHLLCLRRRPRLRRGGDSGGREAGGPQPSTPRGRRLPPPSLAPFPLRLLPPLPPHSPARREDVAEAVLLAALFPAALRPGQGVRGRGVVRDRLLRHAAGGPGGAELQEAANHPGVPGAGALGAAREEGCPGAGGEVR